MTKFKELKEIVTRLRKEDGCDWDKQQTLPSLQPYLLEEVYEVLSAIEENNADNLKDELGDLLFLVLLMAQISSEAGTFDIDDIVTAISEKMVRRHPHVFSKTPTKGTSTTWEQQKSLERPKGSSTLDGVPKAIPSLLRAYRVTEKASNVGFDWASYPPVREKLNEELEEFDAAIKDMDTSAIEHEFGDVLFTLVNMSRFLPITPESSLRQAVQRFEQRFKHVEEAVTRSGSKIHQVSIHELEEYWSRAKEAECS